MVFYLSFKGSFSKLFGLLPQPGLLAHQIFRRFAVS
jgi:hypothetical protein